MTHKARILQMLREAGDYGISSKLLYAEFMGRGAARIKELREEGYEIDSSERVGKYCIYKLQGRRGAGDVRSHAGYEAATRRGMNGLAGSEAPGDKTEVLAVASGGRPSMFDYDADWDAVR